MNIKCEECGERIPIGFQYYHDSDEDLNYHLDCLPKDYPTKGLNLFWNDPGD